MLKVKSLGRAVNERINPAYTVWEQLPKKPLKKHPKTYIICPDFKVRLPRNKFLTPEQQEETYKFAVQMFCTNRKEATSMLNHMITCGKKEVVAGKFVFWLHAVNYSNVSKAGVIQTSLIYTFKLRQLRPREIKKIKLTEENYG